jgi:hypothetical protein
VYVSRQIGEVQPHKKPLFLNEEAMVAVGKYVFEFSDDIGLKAT